MCVCVHICNSSVVIIIIWYFRFLYSFPTVNFVGPVHHENHILNHPHFIQDPDSFFEIAYCKESLEESEIMFMFIMFRSILMCVVLLTLLSSSLAAEKNHVLCFLLKWTILKGKTLLDVVSSAALITLWKKMNERGKCKFCQ